MKKYKIRTCKLFKNPIYLIKEIEFGTYNRDEAIKIQKVLKDVQKS